MEKVNEISDLLESLRSERDKARLYFEVAETIMVLLSTDQSVSLINRKGAEILGYPSEEIIGRKWFDTFIPERERARVKQGFAEIIAGRLEPNEYFENPILRKDGQERVIAWHNAVIRDQEGAIIATLSSGDDITERRRHEEALRQSEEKFLKAFQSSPALMAISTIDEGRYIEVNERFLAALGFRRDEVIGKTSGELSVFANPDQRSRVVEIVKQKGFARDVDVLINTRDGRKLHGVFSVEIIELQDKKYLLTVMNDVTERRRFEAMFRDTVEATSAAIGRDFFRSLVKHLATALEMRYAVVGKLVVPAADRIETLAVWKGGRAGKNFHHDLAGTPCENVVGKTLCLYPSNARGLFPKDRLMADMDVESFLGVPLFGSSGEPLGVLVVMDDKPLGEAMIPHARALISIFAARAAAELERLKVEDELRDTSERLRTEREALAQKNIALKQILDHLQQERADYRHEISAAVENLLMPFLRKLRAGGGQLRKRDVDILQNALDSIVGKGLDQFQNNYSKLSPRERDICERIKGGMSSKEIAEALKIDVLTVHKHRDSIRRKLQLKHKSLNLTTYLRSKQQ